MTTIHLSPVTIHDFIYPLIWEYLCLRIEALPDINRTSVASRENPSAFLYSNHSRRCVYFICERNI
jgi:hypothetical protein